MKNAKRGRAVGGMSVYSRNKIVKYIKRIDEKCTIGIILNIDKSFTYTNENVFLMFIYLPPLESPFYLDKEVKGIFLLEDCIARLYTEHNITYLLLMGDLNARCGDLSDLVSVDHCISLLEQYNDLFDCPVVDVRSLCDKTMNTQGQHLIDLCKIYYLYVMNGRIGSDRNIGH